MTHLPQIVRKNALVAIQRRKRELHFFYASCSVPLDSLMGWCVSLEHRLLHLHYDQSTTRIQFEDVKDFDCVVRLFRAHKPKQFLRTGNNSAKTSVDSLKNVQ